jgi:uncharacterized protein YbaA (DUF1428 family)/uncharacterized glyoxalase superfamily protein PhnB
MTYIDGFVIAVPTANKQKFIDHAKLGDSVFMDLGATRILECWGDDVPAGKLTDFRMAVKAKDNETVVFSWIEWPDKATRDVAYAKMQDWMKNPDKADPRMNPSKNPMPFDGKRMIFGGFAPLLDLAKPISGQAPAIQPYLFFRGRCEEAIDYYKAKLGAEEIMKLRFKDNPDRPQPDKVSPALSDKIMHAALRIHGNDILMSDGMKSGPLDFQCMSLALSVPTEADADRIFNALAADGTVTMPIGKTFFSERFGGVTDKFGVAWMVMVTPQA